MPAKAKDSDGELLIRHVDAEFGDGLVSVVLGSGGYFYKQALPISVATRLYMTLGVALDQARSAAVAEFQQGSKGG